MGQTAPLTRRPDAAGTTDTAAAVDTVLARLRGSAAGPPERDGVAVFHRVYLAVAEEAARRPAAGRPATARAAAALHARLAGRYLAAVDPAAGPRRAPDCWRPLLQARRHPGVRPLQFALAGLHAHTGHDLALAVVDTCAALGCEPAGLEGGFERVGDLLAALEERAREDLVPGPDLLRIADPLTHLLGAWHPRQALDAAWTAARTLWALRRVPELAGECARGLDAAVGLTARMMLTPLPR
ncbi:DUF5995 family protein [Streptomyces sp. PsTaAH-124]|uniref:DUF5995 family protein n=1 Tax=Streptomyces sp. PsTaAH-124 TaxID=1157638 RepID=UPI0003688AC0|nr:DUF5995 family protein [Streptomyces sp. PsTaAH-124]